VTSFLHHSEVYSYYLNTKDGDLAIFIYFFFFGLPAPSAILKKPECVDPYPTQLPPPTPQRVFRAPDYTQICHQSTKNLRRGQFTLKNRFLHFLCWILRVFGEKKCPGSLRFFPTPFFHPQTRHIYTPKTRGYKSLGYGYKELDTAAFF
jgi:hypothetical protein